MINAYIESKKFAWAPSTLKSEQARLNSIEDLLDNDPSLLWDKIKITHKPYSRVTLWTRLVDYLKFANPTRALEFEEFRRKNARLFKHVYKTKTPSISFEEATQKIKEIKNPSDRALALQILGSGERYSEATQQLGLEGSSIVGKGNKPRTVFRPEVPQKTRRSYSSLLRSLKQQGLRPHDLRKLFASKLVEMGMKEADLCQVMGWSNFQTAKSYLKPKAEQELREVFKQIHKDIGESNETHTIAIGA